ncbi:unnamed protein product [Orchesella dallaii]|uniref:Uncharacterized protein n=1 Tax=Orchesella dallaii TaxID=48710 RepID=A0ABP1R2S8_9HEXA
MCSDGRKVVLVCRCNVEDLTRIITSAIKELTKVFTNFGTNSLLVISFQSSFIFSDLDSVDLQGRVKNTVAFTDIFCARLKQSSDVLKALNTLLNPGADLENYQLKIRRIFIPLLHKKVVKVYCTEKPNIGTSIKELELLLKAKEFRIELESQEVSITETDEATRRPNNPVSVNEKSFQAAEQNPLIAFPETSVNSVKNPSSKLSFLVYVIIIIIAMGFIFVIISIIVLGIASLGKGENTQIKMNDYSTIEAAPPLFNNTIFNTINSSAQVTPTNSSKLPIETNSDKSTRYIWGSTLSLKPTTPLAITNITSTIPTENKSLATVKAKKKLRGQLVYVNSTKSMKDKICDPNFDTTLIFQIYDPVDWHSFEIDCSTRIYGVIFQRYTSTRNMHEILNQTINIRNLTIECDKIGSRNKPLPENLPKIELNKLKYLETIAKDVASDCSPVFSYLSSYVSHFGKLQSWNISGITISDDNTPEIQRVIYKMKASVPVRIILNDVTMLSFLDIRTKSMTYFEFHLSIPNISTASVTSIDFAVETVTNFLAMAKYLKEFSSNVPIPDQKMPQVFKNLLRLPIKKLDLTIRIRDDRNKFEFKFIQKLRWLETFELELLDWRKGDFSNPSLLLTNFRLSDNLKEFRVITNFKALPQGATDVHCRSCNKTRNSQGGINLMLDRCLDCNDEKGGCVTSRR